MRRSRQRGDVPNPFVVLSDVTISLSFIVLIFGLASIMRSGSALLDVDRQDRQDSVRLSVMEAFRSLYPQATLGGKLGALNEHGVVQEVRPVYERPGGARVGSIYENAGYQRVQFLRPMFRPYTDDLTPDGRKVYLAIGKAIRDRWESVEYMYLHGVVNNVPNASTLQEESLSRQRAQAVFRLLQSQGVIQTPEDVRRTKGGPTAGKIDLKYTMWYGTGDYLYAEDWSSGQRVDVLLFFSDKSTKRRI